MSCLRNHARIRWHMVIALMTAWTSNKARQCGAFDSIRFIGDAAGIRLSVTPTPIRDFLGTSEVRHIQPWIAG